MGLEQYCRDLAKKNNILLKEVPSIKYLGSHLSIKDFVEYQEGHGRWGDDKLILTNFSENFNDDFNLIYLRSSMNGNGIQKDELLYLNDHQRKAIIRINQNKKDNWLYKAVVKDLVVSKAAELVLGSGEELKSTYTLWTNEDLDQFVQTIFFKQSVGMD